MRFTYEVTGKNTETVLNELSEILDTEELPVEDMNAASMDGSARVAFSVKCVREKQEVLTAHLYKSSVFSTVKLISSTESE
jgi:hypothetical protein